MERNGSASDLGVGLVARRLWVRYAEAMDFLRAVRERDLEGKWPESQSSEGEGPRGEMA
jgi:hypothetical protein